MWVIMRVTNWLEWIKILLKSILGLPQCCTTITSVKELVPLKYIWYTVVIYLKKL